MKVKLRLEQLFLSDIIVDVENALLAAGDRTAAPEPQTAWEYELMSAEQHIRQARDFMRALAMLSESK